MATPPAVVVRGLMDTDLQRLAVACNKAAEHYGQFPASAGPEVVIGLYRAMATLASMIDEAVCRREQPVHQKRLH